MRICKKGHTVEDKRCKICLRESKQAYRLANPEKLKEEKKRYREKHPRSVTKPLYSVWHGMMGRCYNPKYKNYKYYGERGITVCELWRDYKQFEATIEPRPTKKHTLERIDNNKGYEPSNVRWATSKEQSNNTRYNRMITYQNLTLSVSQWAEKLGIKKHTLFSRLRRGKSFEEAIRK